jgi:hypothetical protein
MEPRRTTEADPRETWEGHAYGPPPRAARGPDLAALFVFLDAIRSAIPRELEGRFNALVRELLLTLRSLIDWYLERLDRPARGPQVEDIPID